MSSKMDITSVESFQYPETIKNDYETYTGVGGSH